MRSAMASPSPVPPERRVRERVICRVNRAERPDRGERLPLRQLGQRAPEAFEHAVESAGDAPHLVRPTRGDPRRQIAPADRVRCYREL